MPHEMEEAGRLGQEVCWRLVESSADGLVVIDPEGAVRFANPAAVALFRGPTARLIGSYIGTPVVEEAVELIVPGEGGLRYIEMRATEISWEGKTASLASLRDVTEHRRTKEALQRAQKRLERTNRALGESEALFRRLVESAPDAICVVTDGKLSYVNPAACRLYGAESPRQLLGKPVEETILPSLRPLFRSRWRRLTDSQEPTAPVEQIFIRLDGTHIPVEVSSVPIHYFGRRSALTFGRDIAERKTAEQRNRQLEIEAAEAQAANRAKSKFLSTMSHELRTPMNAILGYSQLLMRNRTLDPQAAESVRVIHRSGEHLLHIIDDVLDMAKVEAGAVTENREIFSLRSLLDELEAIFRLQAETKGVRFEVRLNGQPVEYVVADKGKIRQVLINLLGNAVKFTERGRIELRVSLREGQDDRLVLCAEVEDTGIGVTPEEQGRLFEPFVQAKGGQALYHGGTGLGLAISRGLAVAMGGDLSLTSRHGVGSTFHLELPVEIASQPTGDDRQSPRGSVVCLRAGQEPPRILIVDDSPASREWLSELLRLVGFTVRCAESGEEALAAWEEWRPRLVLMDIHMPNMDGLEATKRIRSAAGGAETTIFALTADALEEQRAEALSIGVDAFVSKPVREDDLFEKIGSHLALEFDCEEDNSNGRAVPADSQVGALPLPAVPGDLVPQMADAIRHGDKVLLDDLILKIEDRGDGNSAERLRFMADRYQYDQLTELLGRE